MHNLEPGDQLRGHRLVGPVTENLVCGESKSAKAGVGGRERLALSMNLKDLPSESTRRPEGKLNSCEQNSDEQKKIYRLQLLNAVRKSRISGDGPVGRSFPPSTPRQPAATPPRLICNFRCGPRKDLQGMRPCGRYPSLVGTSRSGKTSGVCNRASKPSSAVVTPTGEEFSTEGVHKHRKGPPAKAGNLWAPDVASCSKQWGSLETIPEYPLGISELPPDDCGNAVSKGDEQGFPAAAARPSGAKFLCVDALQSSVTDVQLSIPCAVTASGGSRIMAESTLSMCGLPSGDGGHAEGADGQHTRRGAEPTVYGEGSQQEVITTIKSAARVELFRQVDLSAASSTAEDAERSGDGAAEERCVVCVDDEANDGGEPAMADGASLESARAQKSRARGVQPSRNVRRRQATTSKRVIAGHAIFLQRLFRRQRAKEAARAVRLGRAGDAVVEAQPVWVTGGVRRAGPIFTDPARPRCQSRAYVEATEADFEEQRVVADKVLAHYDIFSDILKIKRGRTPVILDGMSSAGGVSDGVRRGRMSMRGIDKRAQPEYVRRFGKDAFVQGDALDVALVRKMVKESGAFGAMYSPPCKIYSTVKGEAQVATEPALIPQTRDLLELLGILYSIENVLGASAEMEHEQSRILRGFMFGLRVDRGRRWETNFPLHIDEALREGSVRLRANCCLGRRRRWLRIDPLGRPVRRDCCDGNIFAVQGSAPTKSTLLENQRAMGMDPDHMGWASLSQAIPPAMAQLVAGQMAMHQAHAEYGVPIITYDDTVRDPSGTRATLQRWLRGAGCDAKGAGMELVERPLRAGDEAATPAVDQRE